MDQEAAGIFLRWLEDNGARIAAVCAEIHSPELRALGPEAMQEKVQGLYLSLAREIDPLLSAVAHGLQFELGPGALQPFALILSAGGIRSLIEPVRYLSDNAPVIPDLDIIAFKPRRPLSEGSTQIVHTRSGPKPIGPHQTYFSLSPELTKLKTTIYFEDYTDEERQAWGQVGFNFLDFALGEYEVMQSVGGLAFCPLSEAVEEISAVTALADRFAAEKSRLVEQYRKLEQDSPERRFSASLDELKEQLDEIDSSVAADNSEDDVFLTIRLWSREPRAAESLASALPSFTVDSEECISAVGTGREIQLTGSVPHSGFSTRPWLRDVLYPVLPPRTFLVEVAEQPPPSAAMIQFLGAQMLKLQRFDEAIEMLQPAAARLRKTDDGTVHSLLALACYRAGRYDEAVRAYETVLSLAESAEIRGEALTNMGGSLQRLGRLDEALVSFKSALELDAGKATRYFNVGQCCALRGETAVACDYLGQALQLKPDIKDHLMKDPDLAELRKSPEFGALMKRTDTNGR